MFRKKQKKEWETKNRKKALAYVEAITQQGELALAAAQAPDLIVCTAALERLSDKGLLEQVARDGAYSEIRIAACERIGHIASGCKCSRCGKEFEEKHQWQDYIDEASCPERGSGQHLDPCYGADCSQCHNACYKCSLCGKLRKK